MTNDDVTVELEQGVLCIRSETKSRRDEKLDQGRRLECAYGAFSRRFRLPRSAATPPARGLGGVRNHAAKRTTHHPAPSGAA